MAGLGAAADQGEGLGIRTSAILSCQRCCGGGTPASQFTGLQDGDGTTIRTITQHDHTLDRRQAEALLIVREVGVDLGSEIFVGAGEQPCLNVEFPILSLEANRAANIRGCGMKMTVGVLQGRKAYRRRQDGAEFGRVQHEEVAAV